MNLNISVPELVLFINIVKDSTPRKVCGSVLKSTKDDKVPLSTLSQTPNIQQSPTRHSSDQTDNIDFVKQ